MPLLVHAVAVVDAVADRLDVALLAVGGGERLAVEARARPSRPCSRGTFRLRRAPARRSACGWPVAQPLSTGRGEHRGQRQRHEREPVCDGPAAWPLCSHGRHYLGVRIRATATSRSLGGSERIRVRRCPGRTTPARSAGGPAHRTHADHRRAARAPRAARRAADRRGALLARVADRRSAHPRSRGAGVPGRTSLARSASPSGTRTGTPVTTCPATACCSRRWLRCSGVRAASGRCRCSPRSRCSSASCVAVYGRTARWGVAWFAVAAVGDVWIGRLVVRAGRARLRSRRCWRSCAARLLWAGAARGAVRGGQPGGRCSCSALAGVDPRRLRALAAGGARAGGARRRRRGGARAAVRRGRLSSRIRFCRSRPRRSSCWRSCGRCRAGAAAARRGARVSARLRRCACAIHTPMGSNIERYGGAARRAAARCAPWPASGGSRRRRRRTRGGCARAVRDRSVGRVGAGARDAGRRRQRIDERRLLRAGRALPGGGCGTGGRAGARRGAAHALALGGRAARAEPSRSRAAGRSSSTSASTAFCSRPGLTAAGYERWLHAQAVAYVALPDTSLDPSSAQEGRLIRRGLPYLREVFASRHWRIYRCSRPRRSRPGPGRLTALGTTRFALRARPPRAPSSCACTSRATGRSRGVRVACAGRPEAGRR